MLSKALGFVDRYFEEDTTETCYPSIRETAFYKLAPLRADTKMLSAVVMEVLLGCEKLQLRSENDAYHLLCAWLSQTLRLSCEDDRRALFKQLLPPLRFHHMSHDYLCAVVSACLYANASGLLPYILSRSHAMRTVPLALAKERGSYLGGRDRRASGMEYTFQSHLALADLQSLQNHPQEPNHAHKYLGVVAGFPVAMAVRHRSNHILGGYVHVGTPVRVNLSAIERCACFNISL